MTRMVRLAATAALLLLLAALPPLQISSGIRANERDGAVTGVEAIGIVVSDLERSIAFFSDVLTFERAGEFEIAGEDYERLYGVFGLRLRLARLRLGEEHIDLMQFLAPEGRAVPADSRSNDLWFQHIAIVVADMPAAYARLRAHNVRHASPGPQRLPDWNRNAGGIEAFYFKDPDGHPLEILAFPRDKGAAKWHRPTDRLFLGIDHTAIVVDDTEVSLRFYRDGLGMRVAGESGNYGIEQERLNNVFGARLRITGLTAGSGPGVEFLDYLAPDDGRAAPADARSNDLVAWQTRFRTADVPTTLRRLGRGTFGFVSPGAVALSDRAIGLASAALLTDPDGHRALVGQ